MTKFAFFAGIFITLGALALTTYLGSKSATSPGFSEPSEYYREALARTAAVQGLEADSIQEKDAIQRVVDLFINYEAAYLKANIPKVYAQETYFRDGFKELTTSLAVQRYMLHGLEAVRSVEFSFEPTLRQDGNYIFRWVMKINLERDPTDRFSETIGMSHIRFNRYGEIIFQQDYWDPTDMLYSRIPVANWLINKVHKRL